MPVPWWLMPGAMFGISQYLKSMGSRGKFRWVAKPELEVRGMSILVVVTEAESGDALPPPPSGYRWKPIQLTFQPGPLSAPAIVTVHVLDDAQAATGVPGVAGFLTVQHLQGLGLPPPHPHHHHHRGGGPTVIYDSGPFYPYPYPPLYAEDLPTLVSPTETWTVEWTANGKKQQQTVRTELEARRLKDALAASKIVATISRGGVI